MLAIGMPFIQWDICLIIETFDSSGILYLYIILEYMVHGAAVQHVLYSYMLYMLVQYMQYSTMRMYNASMALQLVSQNDHRDGGGGAAGMQ